MGVGSVWVNVSQSATDTHAAGTARALLTVSAAAPTISGLPAIYSKAYPATTRFDLPRLTSDNPIATTPLVFTSTDTGVASIVAQGDGSATVTLTGGLGTTLLVVSQPAGNGWDAGSVSVPLTVSAGTAQPVPLLATRSLPFNSPDLSLARQVNGVSGDITDYTSSVPGVAEVLADGVTVSIRGVGTTTLSARQNGVVMATGQLEVTKAAQTLTFADRTVSLATGPSVSLQAAASSGGPVSFKVVGGDPDVVHLGDDGRTLWLLWDSLWARDHDRDAKVLIEASVAGSANHEAASVTREFTVQRSTGSAPAWYQLRQALPATVPGNMDGGGVVHRVVLRHNMSAGREFVAHMRPTGNDAMRCRVDSVQRGTSPERDTVITLVFEGGVGSCALRMSSNDFDTSLPVVLGTVRSATSDAPVTYSSQVWPAVTVQYGNPVGVPVADFPFDLYTNITAQPAGVVALSRAFNGMEGHIAEGNNPPTLVGIAAGSTVLTGRVGGKVVTTTVTVARATTQVAGWNTTMAMALSPEGEAFQPPLSNNPAPMRYRVLWTDAPTELARVDNGRVIPLRMGDGFIVMEQDASANHTAVSVMRRLYVTAAAPVANFGTAYKTYGEPAFTLQLPPEVSAGVPVSIAYSSPGVVQATVDTATGVLKVAIERAGSTEISLVQNGVTKARATVHVAKASPQLDFVALNPQITLVQPVCPSSASAPRTVPVHFPRLNEGAWTSDVNGQLTVKHARLSSWSSGAVTYRTSDGQLLSFSGGHVGELAASFSTSNAGTAGKALDLVIDQAETTNHRAQTIRIPGALFIRSQTDMPSCPV